jgi:hypothetical protein
MRTCADVRAARRGRHAIYIHDGAGITASRLKVAAAGAAPARNMNRAAKLAEMAAQL